MDSVKIMLSDTAKATLHILRNKMREVYTVLQKGYPENVYQRALCIELQHAGLRYDLEATMSVLYKEHIVGQIRADIIIRGDPSIVIETKATAGAIKPEERWQLSRYMKLQEISLGILVNFPQVVGTAAPQIDFLVKDEVDDIYVYDLDESKGTLMM
jgi:GxxExxY protein